MASLDGKYHFTPDDEMKASLAKRRELRQHAGEFLLAGGLLVGHADGELVEEERSALVDALEELFDDPETQLHRMSSPEHALAALESSMAWLKENGGERRERLYKHLAVIVAADGVLDDDEIRFMQNIALNLGLPLETATGIMHQAMKEAGLA